MAIDFPNSPTVGQIYTASNGIVYVWNGTLWTASSSASSAGGDFFAYVTNVSVGTTFAAFTGGVIATGNSGGWYNSTNGRYTPPAGRYLIYGTLSGNPSGGSSNLQLVLQKNGVNTFPVWSDTGTPTMYGQATISVAVDANGTDYFQLLAASPQFATGANAQLTFGAFPLSGIKGPPGDPGQLGFRLLQRTEVSSAVPAVTIQGIASDINDLMFTFDLTPVTNADTLALQFYDNTGALATTSYIGSLQQTYDLIADGGAPSAFGQTTAGAVTNSIILSVLAATARVNNVTGIRGTGTIPNIRAARPHSCNFQCNYVNDTLGSLRIIQGGGWRNVATAITGLRLTFNSNIASGAFSVWGSP